MLVVADGMGGHMRGEVAAQIAVQAMATVFQQEAVPDLPDPAVFLDTAVRGAHRCIIAYQRLHEMPEAPRTTIVCAVVQDGKAWWAHAGDSRLIWIGSGGIKARTRDHSKVESMVTLGMLDAHLTEKHPERNKVHNCLGSPYEPTVEVSNPVMPAGLHQMSILGLEVGDGALDLTFQRLDGHVVVMPRERRGAVNLRVTG